MSWKTEQALMGKVLDMACQQGAQEADLIIHKGRAFSLSSQGGKIDKYKVSGSSIIGLRTIQDQRIGLSYSESFSETALQAMVRDALANGRFSDPDEHEHITTHHPKPVVEVLPRLNQDDNTPVQDKIALTLHLENEVLKRDSRVEAVPYNGYSDGEAEYYYANHRGTFCHHREKSFSCYTSALLKDGSRQSMFHQGSHGRRFQELDADHCVAESLGHAVPMLDAASIPTGYYDVIFEEDQLDSFLGSFMAAFSGQAAMEGTSPFRDKLQQEVASPLLSLRDEPMFADGFYYSRFDDEGNLRQSTHLIENGRLLSLLHNTATAAYFKTTSTAHAVRGPKSALGVSSSQLVIQPGQSSDSDVAGGRYLKVIGIQGLHSGTNAISGHFSLGIYGILYEQGREVQRVKDVTISGNFYQQIKKIAAVGQTLHASSDRTFFSPMIRFEGISVAGR